MSIVEQTLEIWTWNRGRTLALLDGLAELPDPAAALGWRPGPGRAHIAWQLMHIGITEELFATERLTEKKPSWSDLVPRYKGGSVPDDNIPSIDEIRELLNQSRSHLVETFSAMGDDQLEDIPPALKERGWSFATVLKVLSWHEPHHQGQAHITLNLYKAAQL